MDKILVAIDGSKHSSRVLDFAVQLAQALDARILLVNVAPDIPVPEGYSEYAKEEGMSAENYYETVSQEVVNKMSDRIGKGLKFDVATGVGNPADFILKTAKSSMATMIVIGVFGLHHLPRIRSLGSVSRRIVENSSIPVVLVP